MELNENRRKARSLLAYFDRVSESRGVNEDNTQVVNFFAAKNLLLKINEIPISLKTEIRHDPLAVWNNLELIISLLKKSCGQKSQNKQLQKFEEASENQALLEQNNSQFLDAMVDFFDDSVPQEFKNQFSPEQQQSFDSLCSELGEEKIEFIKNHEGLLEDTMLAFTQTMLQADASIKFQPLKSFNKKMEEAMIVEDMLNSFLMSLGIGMNEMFQKKGFSELKKYALLLKNQKEIRELAEMLGHSQRDEKRSEKKARDSVTQHVSKYHPKPSYRGNIVGFNYTGDVSKVVPTEISLLNNPQTQMLFYHKFAEKQLLSYNYVMNLDGKSNKKTIKGPVVMAIDTSFSMAGKNEKIAKTVAFAIAQTALKEKRKCFLISFSSSIAVLDLSSFSGEKGLTTLTDFLCQSFNGGTDIEPCVNEALNQLEKKNYANSDILIISDFIMRDFEKKTKERIEKQKKNGTKLYSLLIGKDPNKNVLNYFDEQWFYKGKKGEQMSFIHDIKNRL